MFRPRIAFRDVARATDTRTAIFALLPPGVALVEVAPYLLRQRGTERDEAYLLGVVCSIPFDWYARRFVEAHLKYHLLNEFPVPRVDEETGSRLSASGEPRPGDGDFRPIRDRVIEISARLASPDTRYASWANAVDPALSPVAGEERPALISELDALVSLLYGLSAAQVGTMFKTFHRVWDYQPRLESALTYHAVWQESLSASESA